MASTVRSTAGAGSPCPQARRARAPCSKRRSVHRRAMASRVALRPAAPRRSASCAPYHVGRASPMPDASQRGPARAMMAVSARMTFAPWYPLRRGPPSPSSAAPAVPQALVPAVVGTLISGRPRSRATPFAQSITAPPPQPMTRSAPCSRPATASASTAERVFCTWSPCSTRAATPRSSRLGSSVGRTASMPRVPPMTSARLPSWAACSPASRVAPGPTTHRCALRVQAVMCVSFVPHRG